MKELYTEIQINAPLCDVWRALADFNHYEKWNPFITKAQGELKPNAMVNIVIRPPGKKAQNARVALLKVDPEKELRWLGHFLSIPGLIDGEHIFAIETSSDGSVRLIHREYFRGVLVPFVWPIFLNTHMREGFEAFNLSLKKLLENNHK
jgi:hypothetical protein